MKARDDDDEELRVIQGLCEGEAGVVARLEVWCSFSARSLLLSPL